MVDGIVKIPWRVTSTERRPEFNQSRNRKEGIPATRQKTDEPQPQPHQKGEGIDERA